MTDQYPLRQVRRNDTITTLSRQTEAEYARLEFQQVVLCTGEHLTVEPIKFGRAFEEPPFFSFAGVVRTNAVGTIRNEDQRFINPGPDNTQVGAMEVYWKITPVGSEPLTGFFHWTTIGTQDIDDIWALASGWKVVPGKTAEVIDWTYEFNHPSSTISVPTGGLDGDHLIIMVARPTAVRFATDGFPGFTRNLGISTSPGADRAIGIYLRQVNDWTIEPSSYAWVDDSGGDPVHMLMILVRGLQDGSGIPPYDGTAVHQTHPTTMEIFDSPDRFTKEGNFNMFTAYAPVDAPAFTALDGANPTAFFIGHLTIGVSEWIQDSHGMYIGANLWYKMDRVAT